MGDTFIIAGLREKRSSVAGRIVDLKREADLLQADLYHIDAVLRLYGEEPGDIPTKGRMPKRSEYFGRSEVSRRCYEMLRERGTVSAEDMSIKAMVDKGMDPLVDKKRKADFTRRFLCTLHDLVKAGTVQKVGNGRGVRWKLMDHLSGDNSL
jgi:hypothetical protein